MGRTHRTQGRRGPHANEEAHEVTRPDAEEGHRRHFKKLPHAIHVCLAPVVPPLVASRERRNDLVPRFVRQSCELAPKGPALANGSPAWRQSRRTGDTS